MSLRNDTLEIGVGRAWSRGNGRTDGSTRSNATCFLRLIWQGCAPT